MTVVFHFCCPLHESPKVAALSPHELPEFEKADLSHLHTAVGFDPPQQVGTAPRREAVPTRRIPEEAEDIPHAKAIIITKALSMHGLLRRLEQKGNVK